MTGKQIRKAINSLREEIDLDKDKKLIEIFKIAKMLVKKIYDINSTEKTSTELQNKILELNEESFINTYKKTSKGMKDIYEDVMSFNEKNLEKLTYTEDGKNYKERLDIYYAEILKDKKEGKTEKETLLRFQSKLEKLLNTETRHIETAVKLNKKPKGELYVSIGHGCGGCPKGIFKEDEVPGYPPFHPECVCNWHYLRETDIEDEVELIEEFEE
jgi:hypothetical protein